jgi:hypothetical protein
MMEEPLRKPLFIHSQDWYIPSVCVDCPDFNFVPLPEGAVAYCNKVEDDKKCMFGPADERTGLRDDLTARQLLDLEPMMPVEAD